MELFSVIMFAVSSNLDNLAVGISYGIKRVHISALPALLIGLITLGGTMVSMALGKNLLPFLPGRFAQLLGSIIILAMGGYGTVCFWTKRVRANGAGTSDANTISLPLRQLALREAAVLGTALAVNNMGLGIGASISGLQVLPASAASLCFSLLFLVLGNRAGRLWLSSLIGRYAEPIASGVMVLLGVYQLFS